MYIYHILFTHAFTDGLLSCFYIMAIVNSAAVNFSMQVTVGTNVFISGLYRQSPLQAPSLWQFSQQPGREGLCLLLSPTVIKSGFRPKSVLFQS